jgi:enoyl-CoA hydratase/carnithine racemase
MPDRASVRFEVADRVATVTIDRPEAMNALDPETLEALSEAWTEVRDNPSIWVAIVTGAGDKAFCAGADLKKTIPARPGVEGQANWRMFQPNAQPSLDDGLELWKPVIAAVNGYCLGAGLTLMSACDIRVASTQATFGLPEVRRGIVPTLGATQRLPRQLPHAIAMELLLLGEPLSAAQALQFGLVNAVVEPEEVMAEAGRYAERFLAGPPLTARAIKEATLRGLSMPLAEGMRLESLLSQAVRRTDDFREGPRAFAEKREPRYTGN